MARPGSGLEAVTRSLRISLALRRPALVTGNCDVQAAAAHRTAHGPAPADVTPVPAEPGDQHAHVDGPKAVAAVAPRANAVVVND